ncbi:MAG: hypothetical protein NTV06_09820, partial [candidate division Zixibacteria bacterium]|nr:hypothetical protein [candidate division Zixibacteria bacterium]
MAIFTSSAFFYLSIIFGIIIMLRASNIPYSAIYCNGKPFIILVLITALYHLLFSARDSQVVATILGFNLTEGGIGMAVSFSLRVLVFIGLAFFITLTT